MKNSRILSYNSLFFTLVVINSIPILVFPYFQTLDGPSHLYNVNLLKGLIIEKNTLLGSFFSVKKELIPNWSSHFILLLLRTVFSSAAANKLFLLVITLGLPLSVYSVLHRTAPRNQFLAVFSLPFVYTFLFGLGFYNFCLGVVVYMVTLNYWMRVRDSLSAIRITALFLLMAAAYFTHIFIFILVPSTLMGYSFIKASGAMATRSPDARKFLVENLVIFIAALPFLVLLVNYLILRGGSSSTDRIPLRELCKWIMDVRPLIIYNYPQEVKLTRAMFFLAAGLILYSAAGFFRNTGNSGIRVMLNHSSTPFFILAGILLVLYFIIPDTLGSGGSYVSDRILILAWLLGLTGLFTLDYPRIIRIPCILIILAVNFGLLSGYCKTQSVLNAAAGKFLEAGALVEGNSVVLPIRSSDNWLDLHFANFLGLEKPVVILENYEASTRYFPVEWNFDELPAVRLGDTVITDLCLYNIFPESSPDTARIDYVLTWGKTEPDECRQGLFNLMHGKYDLIYSEEELPVYLFKVKH